MSRFHRFSKRDYFIFIIIGFLGIGLIGSNFVIDRYIGKCNIKISPYYRSFEKPRSAEEASVQVTHLWSREISMSESENSMVISDDKLIVADSGCNDVVAFDLTNGDIVWKQVNPSSPDSILLSKDGEVIYVSRTHYNNEVVAFNVENGDEIWKTSEFSGQRIQLEIKGFLPNNAILVHSNTDGFLPLDAQKGTIDDEILLPDETVQFDGHIFWQVVRNELEAFDFESNQKLWGYPHSNISSSRDIQLIERHLFLNNESKLSVLDAMTGSVLWNLEDYKIVSNVTIENGVVYVMDNQAQLLMLNLENGLVIGTVDFANRALINQSWLALADGIIAIYYKDDGLVSVWEVATP
ncbi:MAG: PQQ-binding-like beta-propeller repeat protein [Anaerolineae bacterium]|nr:MAG: PQQ-binding-like beta-propeller repeat protein [Anaerolineae bacterium]